MKRWAKTALETGKDVYRHVTENDLNDSAAGLAYWTFLSLFPALLAFVSMLGYLDVIIGHDNAEQVRQDIIEAIDRVFGDGSMSGIVDIVVDILDTPRGALALIGLVGALWSMSKGFAGLCRALARIHGRPEARRGIKGRLFALVVGIVSVAVLLVVALQATLGPTFGIGGNGHLVTTAWAVLRVPFLTALMLTWLVVLLKVAPAMPGRFREYLPGAVVSLILVLILGVGAWLVTQLGLLESNAVLGAIGGVLLLLMVLRLLALGLLIGGVVNVVRFERDRTFSPGPTPAPPPSA
ncbi:MAG TPA: YihY/virulence factor BrkB family protein [Acidimicrobiales bacterium]